MPDRSTPPRYRFGEYVLSPRQRLLTRLGHPVPLIPKYFDVLLLLVQRREDAVSKAAIFAAVWSDVVVSDGALAQAVRTLRRALGDESKEPRFIRTVSRHGYRFVCPDVIEEADEGPLAAAGAHSPDDGASARPADAVERLLDEMMAAVTAGRDADARDVAEQLHQLGTAHTVARLTARPHHARALALLRDARWSSPAAGEVPLLGGREAGAAVLQTVALRVGAARDLLVRRWAGGVVAGAAGGAAAGACGGLLLLALPASTASAQSPVALSIIGALAGGAGASGVAAGITIAEATARSQRLAALVGCTAVATSLAGGAAHVVTRALLTALFGLDRLVVGGAIDGLAVGAAAGLGYGLATRGTFGGGLAAPPPSRRILAALVVGIACAVAAGALALSGHPLVGGLVHQIARASATAPLGLGPLGRLIGEPDFGVVSQALLGAFEGAVLGASTTLGLTIRPRIPT